MKPPTTPTRFQTTRRHYHRTQPDGSNWDQWVGGKSSANGGAILKKAGIVLAILAFAGVIALLIQQMR